LSVSCKRPSHLAASLFSIIGVEASGKLEKRINGGIFLLTTLQELYAVGRGQPVTPEVILGQDSPLAKLKCADDLAALSQQYDGDGSRLLKALRNREIKGFQQKKADDFEQWLGEEGYLDVRPRLAEDELVSRILTASAVVLEQAGMSLTDARKLLARALEKNCIY